MLFGELTKKMSRVVQAAGRNPNLESLDEFEDYQRFLEESFLNVYIVTKNIVLLQLLEQLMLTVDPAGGLDEIDESIYHAMKLAFQALGRTEEDEKYSSTINPFSKTSPTNKKPDKTVKPTKPTESDHALYLSQNDSPVFPSRVINWRDRLNHTQDDEKSAENEMVSPEEAFLHRLNSVWQYFLVIKNNTDLR